MANEQTHPCADLAPGDTLPSWSVTAVNDARDSGNPIHEDDGAQRYGFGAGLVAGVTTFGYLLHPVVAALGSDFLRDGTSSIRLRSPVYAGEVLTVTARLAARDAGGLRFELEVRNPQQALCAVGAAQWPAPVLAGTPLPPNAPLPSTRRAATPEALRAAPVLGTLQVTQSAEEARQFADAAADRLDAYAGLVHSAWLLRQANILVDRSVAVGAWVHTASEVQHLGTAQAGETVTVRGQVVALFERKGHDYADIDVFIEARQPLMRVRHTAIFRMAS